MKVWKNAECQRIKWRVGQWSEEPDFALWPYRNLDLAIARTPLMGTLCGLVCFPRGHRLWGKDKGGLTFTRPINIKGVVEKRWNIEELRTYWMLGFDTCFEEDLIPLIGEGEGLSYKGFRYVKEETEKLADLILKEDDY